MQIVLEVNRKETFGRISASTFKDLIGVSANPNDRKHYFIYLELPDLHSS